MKFRHLEYFVTAAEELNFTRAADRLHVSQPPFSKQIHDLEGELGIDLFERQRKGVTLTPAGKSFLIDARRILEDCEASIIKAQRISRGRGKYNGTFDKLNFGENKPHFGSYRNGWLDLAYHQNPGLKAGKSFPFWVH